MCRAHAVSVLHATPDHELAQQRVGSICVLCCGGPFRSSHSSDVAPGHGRCQEGMAGSALAQQGFCRPDVASNGKLSPGWPLHWCACFSWPLQQQLLQSSCQRNRLCSGSSPLPAPPRPRRALLRLLQSSQLRSVWLPSSPGRHPSWSGHPLHPQLARLPRPCPAKPQLRRARAAPTQPPADLISWRQLSPSTQPHEAAPLLGPSLAPVPSTRCPPRTHPLRPTAA